MEAGRPGMGDTIAAAVRATADANGWRVLPADLPLVQPDSLFAVALARLQGTQGAASVIRAQTAFLQILVDIGCVADVDTPDDLAAAHRLLQDRP